MGKAARIALVLTMTAAVAIGLTALALGAIGNIHNPGGPSLQVLLRTGRNGPGVSGDIIVKNARGGRVASTSIGAAGKTFTVGPGDYIVVGISDTGRTCGPTRAVVSSDPQAVFVACR